MTWCRGCGNHETSPDCKCDEQQREWLAECRKRKIGNIVNELTDRINKGEFDDARENRFGIRSRQIVALITLLVEKGVL